MNVRRVCLDDFPDEIVDHVLSYVPDFEFINIGKISEKCQESVRRLIKRRELNFKRCYRLWDEHLVYMRDNFSDVVVSLRLDGCEWLSENAISSVTQLSNLRQLHLIECQICLQTCEAILEMKLNDLSINWGTNWVETFRNRPSNTIIQLFNHLKHLTIFIATDKLPYFYSEICHLMLKYCLELETFKLYDSDDKHCRAEFNRPEQCEFLLPKLKSVIVDLCDKRFEYFSYDRFLKMVRETGRVSTLQEVHMGKTCLYVVEREPPVLEPSTSVYCSPVDEILQMFYEKGFLNPGPFKWHKLDNDVPMTYKVLDFNEVYKLEIGSADISEMEPGRFGGPSARCVFFVIEAHVPVYVNKFLERLKTVANLCTDVTYLDLNVNLFNFGEADKQSLLQILTDFKGLKRLDLSSCIISMFSEVNFGEERVVLGAQSEISENSMRKSNLWEVARSCKSIEEIRITQPKSYLSHPVVSESSLACISQWKNLKELYLYNVSTPEWGGFLPVITRNCPQLTTLYLNDVCTVDTCVYMAWMTECLANAKSLKDLSLFQGSSAITVQFCKNLEQCKDLERMLLDDIVVPLDVGPHFANVLSKLKKLVRVAVCLRDADIATRNVIEEPLKILKASRPSFMYILNTVSICPDLEQDDKNHQIIHLGQLQADVHFP